VIKYVQECTTPPPVPVIVTTDDPVGVVGAVTMVSVDVKLGLPDEGSKLEVAPDGRPEADRLTMLSKPLMGDKETVTVIDSPCFFDPDIGLALIVKSGVVTVNV
jgi:hypothetical protein